MTMVDGDSELIALGAHGAGVISGLCSRHGGEAFE
jgi:hypothetical protein